MKVLFLILVSLAVMVMLWAMLLPARASEIVRDPGQVTAFKRGHPCPATGRSGGACPGWVVDHMLPLSCGGADLPSNMQWQTKEAALQKDRLEWWACRRLKSCIR